MHIHLTFVIGTTTGIDVTVFDHGLKRRVIAAAIALSLLVIAYQPAVERFHADLVFIPLSYDPGFISSLARDLLLGGALLGALGSYIGVRRFVRI